VGLPIAKPSVFLSPLLENPPHVLPDFLPPLPLLHFVTRDSQDKQEQHDKAELR
jgi:hypothetical protein